MARSLSKKRRFEILARDGFRCVYCGRTGEEVPLQIDHIVPVSAGGSDDDGNLATACSDCNLGKGPRGLEARRQRDAKALDPLHESRQ